MRIWSIRIQVGVKNNIDQLFYLEVFYLSAIVFFVDNQLIQIVRDAFVKFCVRKPESAKQKRNRLYRLNKKVNDPGSHFWGYEKMHIVDFTDYYAKAMKGFREKKKELYKKQNAVDEEMAAYAVFHMKNNRR